MTLLDQIMAVPAPTLILPDFDKRPLSYSSLKEFMKSPLHFLHYLAQKKEVTPAMRFGNLVDCMILSPDEFVNRYIIVPQDMPARPAPASYKAKTNAPHITAAMVRWEEFDATVAEQEKAINHPVIDAYNQKKAAWDLLPPDEQEANPIGPMPWTVRLEVITHDWYNQALMVSNRVYSNPVAAKFLKKLTYTQERMRWTDKETGLPMVGIKDGGCDEFILDLKVGFDASPDGFRRQAYNLGYHIQTGAYLEGHAANTHTYPDYYNLVVEPDEPHGVAVYRADKDFIALGKGIYHELLMKVKYCADNNLWHEGYEFNKPFGYHHMELPGYAKRELERFM